MRIQTVIDLCFQFLSVFLVGFHNFVMIALKLIKLLALTPYLLLHLYLLSLLLLFENLHFINELVTCVLPLLLGLLEALNVRLVLFE